MNKDELRITLSDEKFSPRTFSLGNETKDEALCLRFEEGKWCVYYSERGLRTGEIRFASEQAACDYFLEQMRADPTTKLDWKSGFSM